MLFIETIKQVNEAFDNKNSWKMLQLYNSIIANDYERFKEFIKVFDISIMKEFLGYLDTSSSADAILAIRELLNNNSDLVEMDKKYKNHKDIKLIDVFVRTKEDKINYDEWVYETKYLILSKILILINDIKTLYKKSKNLQDYDEKYELYKEQYEKNTKEYEKSQIRIILNNIYNKVTQVYTSYGDLDKIIKKTYEISSGIEENLLYNHNIGEVTNEYKNEILVLLIKIYAMIIVKLEYAIYPNMIEIKEKCYEHMNSLCMSIFNIPNHICCIKNNKMKIILKNKVPSLFQ